MTHQEPSRLPVPNKIVSTPLRGDAKAARASTMFDDAARKLPEISTVFMTAYFSYSLPVFTSRIHFSGAIRSDQPTNIERIVSQPSKATKMTWGMTNATKIPISQKCQTRA